MRGLLTLRQLTLSAALAAGSSAALEVITLDVTNQRRHYTVAAEAYLAAPPAAVIAVVTDFDHLDLISETVISSEHRGAAEAGGDLVYSEIEFCVAFVCQEAVQLMRVYYPNDEQVVSEPIVEQSDLPDLIQQWQVRTEGDGSVLTYTMSVSAEGFIPPLIGPALVRRALRRISMDSAESIERLAIELARTAETEDVDVESDVESDGT